MRSSRSVPPGVAARRHRALIKITHASTEPLGDDARRAIKSAVGVAILPEDPEFSFEVSPHPYSTVTVSATLRSTSPLQAIARLDEALDDALIQAGLFEEFDVSGKVLQVSPIETIFPSGSTG